MPGVCLYFQVHQPYRLRRYSIFDADQNYFDDFKNSEICRRVASKCYLPANKCIWELLRRHEGRFRVAYSLTGVVLDQFASYCPEVIDSFQKLAATGCVEFLSETYYHGLASLYSPDEFTAQVKLHQRKIQSLFNTAPRVFRNTELIYSNQIAGLAHALGFSAALAEGADSLLGARSPNFVYTARGTPVKLLLKNYRLSDDIAFRFSDREWPEWPLTPEKFAGWISALEGKAQTINLFMDYETFGEHQWTETGIFEFLQRMPSEILHHPGNRFLTPSEAVAACDSAGELNAPHLVSWADTERDVSAWLGNAMQSNALQELFAIEAAVKATGDANLLSDWRKLQSSDHFYYMSTKSFADGVVHNYFNPYESPYDSYINFMNVLDNLASRVR